MNILIITHFYEVDGVMGSVRWTNFAHRLAKKNKVYVVTHNSNSTKDRIQSNDNIEVQYIDNECDYVKRGNKPRTYVKTLGARTDSAIAEKKPKFLKEFAKISLYMASMRNTASKNANLICKYLSEQNIEIDYIISTSKPFINCYNAYYVAKKINKPWLLDQRDLPYSNFLTRGIELDFYKYVFRYMDKYVTKYTLVSNGMKDSFIRLCAFNNKQVEKIHVLHNGYTTEDKMDFTNYSNSGKLIIAYAGDLYAGKRDAAILFDALYVLSKRVSGFKVTDVQIQYAGDDSSSLYRDASKYGFEDMIIDNGRVSHKEAVKMQQEADLLLLLTWNTQSDKGILPGKFYEYMLANKPIICITSGDVPGGEAENMVNEMKLGVAVNYVDYENSVKVLSTYLEQQIKTIKQNNRVFHAPINEDVEKFNYDRLLCKLEEIMGRK